MILNALKAARVFLEAKIQEKKAVLAAVVRQCNQRLRRTIHGKLGIGSADSLPHILFLTGECSLTVEQLVARSLQEELMRLR